jgi:hypothetical protein
MAQIIRSGAFLQQCWSIHPLCLAIKRMTEDRTIVVVCSSCKSAHHLSVSLVASRTAASGGAVAATPAAEDEALLSRCLAQHQTAITLRQMDVFQDMVLLRCAECRRHYDLTVAAFETHQK